MDYAQPYQSASWPISSPSPEKSSQLLIREHPHRAIAIVSASHALIFRHSSSTSEAIANGSLTSVATARPRNDGAAAKCMVEFTARTKGTLRDYRPLMPRPIYGTLGLISVNGDVFLAVVTAATRAATVRPGETVENIRSVAFFCLSSSEYDDVVSMDNFDHELPDAASMYNQSLSRRDVTIEHPCHELRKLLSNGSFYFSTDFDVTNRLQDRPINAASFDIDNFDDSFLWNSYMITPLVQFRSRLLPHERDSLDASRILTSAIRGFCRTMTIPQSSAPLRDKSTGLPSYLTIISRLSCRRAGTRFNSRGIDDDGNVANFVETETTYWTPSGILFSYVQVRGSVPVFWEQAADLVPGRQKITVTRGMDATQPAFNKHFDDLEHTYSAVHVIDLLSETKPGEFELSQLYHRCIAHCPLSHMEDSQSTDRALLRETHYDFHAETKGPAGYEAARDIRDLIEGSADGFAYFLALEGEDSDSVRSHSKDRPRLTVILEQEGVFRTNCLDCLDRTNLVQSNISQMAVDAFLGHRGEYATSDFWSRHATLWADNGDALSKIYAGTGALKTSFTRHGKMSLAGAVADLRKSAQRLYHNNFTDPQRQMTIDMLLGRLVGQNPVHLFDPISDFVSQELERRMDEFTSSQMISIWVGTFNLNGRTHGIDQDLSSWLLPEVLGDSQPDIYVVGFQEIVELSAQQIMNSDPSRKQLWEKAIRRCLNGDAQRMNGEKYVLLRSGQLVGAALCIFVKDSVLPLIKNVEGSVKKTGMSGIAGNKGAVAIRFDYANTQLCFVTAHLAAGFANYEDRNRDYATIHHGLRFQRNRGIDDHDCVIWLGDFNYRIGLNNEHARALVKKRDFEQLYENDQLNLQMVAGLAFPFYSEARITFLPTYRFDIGTDEYDSSEKQRIPAWTDRILRKGSNLRQLSYNSAPLRFSDHRPVYATYQCQVSIVDEQLREHISQTLYERRKAEVGDATANNADSDDTDDEELIGYDAIEPGLPPASSDRQRWWLENGKSARVTPAPPPPPPRAIGAPANGHGSMVLNPHRPSNPFGVTEEPDWVTVPRSESRQSFSSLSTSPYEHVNIPARFSTMTPGATSRRIADPTAAPSLPARVGRTATSDEAAVRGGQQQQQQPPPPPPRRQTGASTVGPGKPAGWDAAAAAQTMVLPPPPPRPRPVLAEGSSQLGQALKQAQVVQQQALASMPPSQPMLQQQQARQSSGPETSPASQPKGAKPPPVAKKPAHLTKPAPSRTPIGGSEATAQASNPRAPQPGLRPLVPGQVSLAFRNGSSSQQQQQQQQQLARSATSPTLAASNGLNSGRQTPQAGAVRLPGMGRGAGTGNGARTRVPAPTPTPVPGKVSVDLLDSLGEDGQQDLRSWETLLPASRS